MIRVKEGIFDSKEKKAKNYLELINSVFEEDVNRVVNNVVSSASDLIQEVADTLGEDSGSKNLANSIIKVINSAKSTLNKTPHSLVKSVVSIGQKYQRDSINLEELQQFISKVGKLQTAGKDGYKAMQFLFDKLNKSLQSKLDLAVKFLEKEYGIIGK